MEIEKQKEKLKIAMAALDRMGDEVFMFYCEIEGHDRQEIMDRLLIGTDTDELLDAIPDKWLKE